MACQPSLSVNFALSSSIFVSLSECAVMNDIRDILLPLNGIFPIHPMMTTALGVAEKFQAQLSAIFLENSSEQLIAFAGEGLATGTVTEMMDEALSLKEERLKEIYTIFETLQAQGKHSWHLLTQEPQEKTEKAAAPKANVISTFFSLLENGHHHGFAFRARLADISIVPSLEGRKDTDSAEILHQLLYESGCPLLVIPPHQVENIGTHIAIAWNGSIESSLTLRASLPWLKQAQKVTILFTEEETLHGPAASCVQDFLALHHIPATLSSFSSEKRNIGAALLQATKKIEADMLVMGASSHSRLRQLILGGNTRYVLENTHLPILISR